MPEQREQPNESAFVGRVLQEAGPRVVEMDLPAAECGVMVVETPSGPRVVVLVDPRVDDDRRAQVIAEARRLEHPATAV